MNLKQKFTNTNLNANKIAKTLWSVSSHWAENVPPTTPIPLFSDYKSNLLGGLVMGRILSSSHSNNIIKLFFQSYFVPHTKYLSSLTIILKYSVSSPYVQISFCSVSSMYIMFHSTLSCAIFLLNNYLF